MRERRKIRGDGEDNGGGDAGNIGRKAEEDGTVVEGQKLNRQLIRTHEDLVIYQMAFDAAMQIFQVSKKFPVEERYSLTDQFRRFSRSVCANLAEAWRKRRYQAAFVAKLSDCEAEAAETQVWIKFAVTCRYLEQEQGRELYAIYNQVLSGLVHLIDRADHWTLK